MDETQLTVAEPNQLDTPPTAPMQEASPKVFAWWLLVIFLLVIFSGIVYYLARQNKSLQSQLINNSNVSQSPLPSLSPDPSIDPVADWQVYENNVHHVSFKYPLGWDLTKEDDKSEFNASIKLKKDDVVIHMIFGVNGIGGAGTSYKGTPIKLDGHDVYKYTSQDEKNQIVTIGITDILTESLGVLQLNNKTYIINLRYPSKYKTTGESQALETTFDQILNTIKFINSTLTEEQEVRDFVSKFAQTYSDGNWKELAAMLTTQIKNEFDNNVTNMSPAYYFEKQEITNLIKNSNGTYTVSVAFYLNGKPYNNIKGNPQIMVVKEGGTWKSMTYYLYE